MSRPARLQGLPDIAYHIDKLKRGYDLVGNVLGADHIAQYPDIVAAVGALGYDASRIRIVTNQFVTLVRGGEAMKMSTRRATYVTLDELIDEVGADAVRYFMVSRSPDSQFEFDLNLARERATRTQSTTSSTRMPAPPASWSATRRSTGSRSTPRRM